MNNPRPNPPKTDIIIKVLSALIIIALLTAIILGAIIYFTPAVDCEVSEWGPCDPITGKRKRTVIKEKQGSGKDCPVLEEDCPVNCRTSAWGSCTNGKQLRTIEMEAKNGGTCEPLEQTCVVPFVEGEILKTDKQPYISTYFLDMHPQICPENPINSFKLEDIGAGKFQINYKCADNLVLESKTSKTSNALDTHNMSGLSRTPVECGVGEVVSNYGLKTSVFKDTTGKITKTERKFNFDCLKSTTDLTCEERSTPKSKQMQSHNLICGDDEVIGSIKVKDHGSEFVSFIYNCCKKVLPGI